jgi:hypothetical protein
MHTDPVEIDAVGARELHESVLIRSSACHAI